MYLDTSGFLATTIIVFANNIAFSIALEIYDDLHDTDGELKMSMNYIGALVSGFVSGIPVGPLFSNLLGILGDTLDNYISGNITSNSSLNEKAEMVFTAAIATVLTPVFVLVEIILNEIGLKQTAGEIENDLISNMGINPSTGSNIAIGSLCKLIFDSNRYSLGSIIEERNNGLILIFD